MVPWTPGAALQMARDGLHGAVFGVRTIGCTGGLEVH